MTFKFKVGDSINITDKITTNTYPRGDMGKNTLKDLYPSNNLIGKIYHIENPNNQNGFKTLYTIKFNTNLYGVEVAEEKIKKIYKSDSEWAKHPHIFLWKTNFNLFVQSELGTKIFKKDGGKSRREILLSFWEKDGDWLDNIESILSVDENSDDDEKEESSRTILSDNEISVGMQVWIESNHKKCPTSGIGGIITEHRELTGSDSGCGYSTIIKLDNSHEIERLIFLNYWIRIYSY
jgi:hypothetical protein